MASINACSSAAKKRIGGTFSTRSSMTSRVFASQNFCWSKRARKPGNNPGWDTFHFRSLPSKLASKPKKAASREQRGANNGGP